MSKEFRTREYVESFPIQEATVGDMEIEYKILENKSTHDEDGKDRIPLLFVAGLRITMDMWPPIILHDLAQSNHKVIIYNNRGTGNSTDGTKEYTISQLASD